MIAARNYQSGMQTVRQIEFALFDMLMHDRAQGISIAQVLALLQEVRQEVAVLFPPAWHRLPHAFAPVRRRLWRRLLQLWAEVLSADAYEAFEEAAARQPSGSALGTLDPETGARFRREVLAVGGSRPAAESFAAFRGRAPRIDALLRHSGMSAA